MPRGREEIDWYVEMSDWLERRERRRKWIVLGICVAVPLALMGSFLLYVVLDEAGIVPKVKQWVRGAVVAPKEPTDKADVLSPVSVESFHEGDVKFSQLDNSGLVTSQVHFFRELTPESSKTFTVNRDAEEHGTILLYRLRNLGTGEVFEFRDTDVRKLSDEWTITENGWLQIRDQLQAEMRVSLARPTL